MKRIFSGAFIGAMLLVIPNIMITAQDKPLKEAVFETGDITQFEKDFKSFIPSTDKITPDKLDTIFEVYNGYNSIPIESMDDFNTGRENLEYATKLASMAKMISDSEESIKSVGENLSYYNDSADRSIDDILKEYLEYQTAVTALLKLQKMEYAAKLLGNDVAPSASDLAAAKDKVDQTKTKFTGSLTSLDNSTDKVKKDAVFSALKKMKGDLKVSKPSFDAIDFVPDKGCDKESKKSCQEQAKIFLNNVAKKAKHPTYITIYKKGKKSCVMDKIAKTLGSVFKLGQLLCDTSIKKGGMVRADGSANTGSLACLSIYNNLGNTKDNGLLNPYINKLNNVNAMNLQLLTQGSGAPASIGTGGSTPNNVFNTGTGTGTGTGAGTDVNIGSVSNSGDGVTRYNANQAVSSFYNPSAATYKDMASGASSFVSSIKPASATISNYNNELTSAIVSADPKIANLAKAEENWATSTLNASTSTTQTQQRDALRLEFSRQQAQINGIIAQMDVAQKKLGLANFMAMYGSQVESEKAMQEVATNTVYLKMLQSQGQYAQTRLGLLMGTLGLGRYRYGFGYNDSNSVQDIFNTKYMSASNDNKTLSKALKLQDIKTPLTLKKGWQEDFKKYIAEMSQKAAEAKKKMNEAKVKIRELIAQKLPIVSLIKLPQPGEIRDELVNMQSIKRASLKNLGVINNAMEYHNQRKNAYTADQYATFKDEQTTVNSAMRRTISSIDDAEENVNEAYGVVNSLYKELPRAEALRAVAKQMVAQGL